MAGSAVSSSSRDISSQLKRLSNIQIDRSAASVSISDGHCMSTRYQIGQRPYL
jgi:hypothetical protein